MSVVLTRADFICCVDCPRYDEKPHIFVRDVWLENLYSKPFSAFAMVDAIGVKDALTNGRLGPDRLMIHWTGPCAPRCCCPNLAKVVKRAPVRLFVSVEEVGWDDHFNAKTMGINHRNLNVASIYCENLAASIAVKPLAIKHFTLFGDGISINHFR